VGAWKKKTASGREGGVGGGNKSKSAPTIGGSDRKQNWKSVQKKANFKSARGGKGGKTVKGAKCEPRGGEKKISDLKGRRASPTRKHKKKGKKWKKPKGAEQSRERAGKE